MRVGGIATKFVIVDSISQVKADDCAGVVLCKLFFIFSNLLFIGRSKQESIKRVVIYTGHVAEQGIKIGNNRLDIICFAIFIGRKDDNTIAYIANVLAIPIELNSTLSFCIEYSGIRAKRVVAICSFCCSAAEYTR
ncbi:hypothetical protein U876_07645 [Aeromonas hydrophila NJ-35]|nr:hypothetical protein AHML_14920 [Aeromonas hydrophila ML09-119]AHX33410.1 hypothetical protein V428_15440 [Aeromonas hydrophila subsp. hydrophila AL09-71]AHX70210.1 hypothetical protein V429_15465 [Aeromonas hydrophila pc104A]AJE38593.1 hypothetical protein V469_07675 [Aeromonas hydrophila J-1]AKJ37008.1 hypothetical protein U876_07645 [Aeromonas hydrophila NJ-35]ALQ62822.1 hypothetical protein AS145_07940 [Aeromonas hydrophila]